MTLRRRDIVTVVPRNGDAATDVDRGAVGADNVGATDVLAAATGFAAA